MVNSYTMVCSSSPIRFYPLVIGLLEESVESSFEVVPNIQVLLMCWKHGELISRFSSYFSLSSLLWLEIGLVSLVFLLQIDRSHPYLYEIMLRDSVFSFFFSYVYEYVGNRPFMK